MLSSATRNRRSPVKQLGKILLRPPKKEFWDVDGAITRALVWPSAISASSSSDRFLFMMIPGNPGVIDYYEEFMQCLYAFSGAQLDIVGVQHAGHQAMTPANSESHLDIIMTSTNGQCDDSTLHRRRNMDYLWNLDEQIEHKCTILTELIRTRFSTHRVILAGHSVGAHIATQMLKHLPEELVVRVERVVNLFPTLDNIRNTPNGRALWPLFNPLTRTAASLTAYGMSTFLPESVNKRILGIITGQLPHEVDITINLIHPQVAANCLYLSAREMEEILDLDRDLFDRHIDKMIFYYGTVDGWVPVERYHSMIAKYPHNSHNIHLCPEQLQHAFVLGEDGGALKMAEKVHGWLFT